MSKDEEELILLHATIQRIIHNDIPESLGIEYTDKDKNDKIHILYDCLRKTLLEYKEKIC